MTMPAYRILNRDGSFNVIRQGLKPHPVSDLYHSLLSMKWRMFLSMVLASYIGVNTVFGLLYFFCGELDGAGEAGLPRIADCFFFSVETLATIGYSKISPVGVVSHLLMTLEALAGLMGFAMVTGLLFARFSRPTSRVLFSNRALIAVHDGVPSLMFRIVNSRANQIVEATMNVSLVINEKTAEGEEYRTVHDLSLERQRTAILAASWTVVHPIDEDSPLRGHTRESLEEVEAEILVSLYGTDETFAQTIYARYSYIPSELIWNAAFEDMLDVSDTGKLVVNVNRLSVLKGETARP